MPTKNAVGCIHVKKNGKKCGANAIRGFNRCRYHGGTLMRHSYKHGLYAQYQPPALRDIIEEQRKNPKLMDLREQVATLSGMLAYCFRQTQIKMEKEKRKELEMDELSGLANMSEKVSNAIERTARVGLAVKMMVHIDAVSRMIDMWVDVASRYIPKPKQEKFRKELAALSAKIVSDEDATYAQVLAMAGSAEENFGESQS